MRFDIIGWNHPWDNRSCGARTARSFFSYLLSYYFHSYLFQEIVLSGHVWADLSDLDDDLDKEEMDEEEIDKEEIDEGDFDEKERCQDDEDSMMVKRMSSDKKRSPGGSGGRTENGS